ncbi:peptidoglycan recognition protein family protein [Kovacikia minuta CCNUW1]|uniref:peptidoglycan recognition protein family protein n=1 Tax=Kovacikia minuta TaxID=2931930 RepID=UPI001CCE6C8A|nr:peptidoglycan recognition family protein [Kovacikia minuta]UBF25777.1 peptidoglycan recognition protein family protein [Kovacikia minuta CCNUW1]
MLTITQAPQGAVQVKQQFLITGTASTSYAGRKLMLTIDNQYTAPGPVVAADGTWQLNFLFQQTGNRRLKLAIDKDSVELPLSVVTTLPPTPRLRFANLPQQIPSGQSVMVTGSADGYADGTALLLRADKQFELARPTVQAGKWQAAIGFHQTGKRLIEIIGSGQDRAQVELQVVAAPPRPPRLRFTQVPKPIQAEEIVTIGGEADSYADGAQLVLRVDQKYELARPLVQGGKWQAPILFHQTGSRLIEIIGSEQDRAQVTIDVQAGDLQIVVRTAWNSTPTPAELPELKPLRITIHHTALSGSPSTSASLATDAERMRYIWRSHVNGNGWSDIGYHYIIMPSGRIFEARSDKKRGAHDVVNDGWGIAFDGIYSRATINQQQFQSAVALCTKLCQRIGIKDPVTPIPTPTADYGTRNLPPICGHRDRVATECPGSEGGRTVRLADIRQGVKAKL